jgi:hypothetical protein
MYKKFTFLAVTIVMALSGLNAQNLDEIIKNHFEAVGQENTVKAQTMTVTGKILQMGMELPVTMQYKKPMNFRMEVEIQGMKMVQAYDGQNGWMIMPWTGNLEPQDMGPDELKSLKQRGDFNGDFYNWQEKGYTVTYEGKEDMEGTPAYKIKVVRPDGDEALYFIDQDSYMILKVDSKNLVQGAEVASTVIMGNYKMVDGIATAFSMEMRTNGQPAGQILLDSVKLDLPIEDAVFSKPVSE